MFGWKNKGFKIVRRRYGPDGNEVKWILIYYDRRGDVYESIYGSEAMALDAMKRKVDYPVDEFTEYYNSKGHHEVYVR